MAKLTRYVDDVGKNQHGTLLSLRGRRQVGKSTLLAHYLAQAKLPSMFFTATRHAPHEAEIQSFSEELAASTLSKSGVPLGFPNWEAALRHLASLIEKPSVIVIDEAPYLMSSDPSFEGVLQKAWDRCLSNLPVLLVLVGSDLSTMELLGAYDRPLHQRLTEMVLDPFTVAEVAEHLKLDAAEAIEAYLVAGGFPRVLQAYPVGSKALSFVAEQLEDSASPLVVIGERIVQSEFPKSVQAGVLLRTIGAGQRTFEAISQTSGVATGPLTRSLAILRDDKRIVEQTHPLSCKRSRLSLYHVADPYLRFWLRFLGPNVDRIGRGQGKQVLGRIKESWPSYRGCAVEPLVRRSLERMAPFNDQGTCFGQYWDRRGLVEVDLVGADDADAPAEVGFLGSIKWRDRGAFLEKDFRELQAHRAQVPGAAHADLIGVSRSGFNTDGLDHVVGPADLLKAWQLR